MDEQRDQAARQPIDAQQMHGSVSLTKEAVERPRQPNRIPQMTEKPPVKALVEVPTTNSAGLLILQWLTYAFWGWTLLAVMWLVLLVVASFFDNYDTTAILPYAIAGVVVLLPLSFVCDMFYSRKEPAKKTGGATVVMVIHAVIFALFGIGLLISLVFLLVSIGLNGAAAFDSMRTALVSLLVSVLLYAATFIRTLNPKLVLPVARTYRIAMLVVTSMVIVLAIVGPAAHSVATRDDRLITATITGVSDAVNSYTDTHHMLPNTLGDVSVPSEAKSLVDRGLIRYKAEGKKTAVDLYDANNQVSDEYHYQLCVTYKEASSGDGGQYSQNNDTDTYQGYLFVSSHPAGQVCYKLQVLVDVTDASGVSISTMKL